MKRTLMAAPTIAAMLLLSGCSVVGTWQTVRIAPEGAAMPFARVTFDRDGHFTATANCDGTARTSTGAYRFRRGRLTISPDGGATRLYRSRIRMNGELLLRYEASDAVVEAVLQRMSEQP